MSIISKLLKSKITKIVLLLIIVIWIIAVIYPFMLLSTDDINALEDSVVAIHVSYSNLTYLLREWTIFIVPGIIIFAFGFIVFIKSKEKTILNKMKKGRVIKTGIVIFILIAFLFTQPYAGGSATKTNIKSEKEVAEPLVHHIFVLTFDGARADVFWDTVTFIKNVSSEGVIVDHAVTVDPPVTYPAHTSMFTGVYPEVHGVFENYVIDLDVPDVFEIAAKYDYKSFIVGGNFMSMLGDDAPQGYIERVTTYTGSKDAMDKALAHLDEDVPNIMYVHLPDTDEVGHQFGHDSPQYREAMKLNDLQVSRLFEKLDEMGILNDSLIIVIADHGMFERRHHHILPSLVIDIPLFLWSPVLNKGHHVKAARIVDIAPTILFTLGIPEEEYDHMQGVAIYDAFNETIVNQIRNSSLDLKSLRVEKLHEAGNYLIFQYVLYFTLNYLGYTVGVVMLLIAIMEHKRVKRRIKEIREKEQT